MTADYAVWLVTKKGFRPDIVPASFTTCHLDNLPDLDKKTKIDGVIMIESKVPLVDQCGQVFELADIILRCVLRRGHRGAHRATISDRRERLSDPWNHEREEEEVTLP